MGLGLMLVIGLGIGISYIFGYGGPKPNVCSIGNSVTFVVCSSCGNSDCTTITNVLNGSLHFLVFGVLNLMDICHMGLRVNLYGIE